MDFATESDCVDIYSSQIILDGILSAVSKIFDPCGLYVQAANVNKLVSASVTQAVTFHFSCHTCLMQYILDG